MSKKKVTVLLIQDNPDEFYQIRLKFRGSKITQCELTPTYRLQEKDQFISPRTYDLVLINLDPLRGLPLEGLHQMLQKIHHVPIVFLAPSNLEGKAGSARMGKEGFSPRHSSVSPGKDLYGD